MTMNEGWLALGAMGLAAAAGLARQGARNDEEEDEDWDGGIRENAAIADAPGGIALSIEGKYIGTYKDDPEPTKARSFEEQSGRKKWRDATENALKAFNDWCDEHGVYLSLYWVSDHGNSWRIHPKTGKEIKAKRGAKNEGEIEPQGGFGLGPVRPNALPQLRRRAELELPDERLAGLLFDRDGDVLGGMTFERAVKQDPRRVDAKISQRIGEAFEEVFGPHQGDPLMKGLYLQGLRFARQTHEGQVSVKALVSLVEQNLNRALYDTFPRMPHDARIILRRSQPIFDAAFTDAARMAAQASRAAAGTEDGPEWRALAEILAEHPQHMRRALAEALPGPVGPRDRMLGGPGAFRALPGPRGGRNQGSRAGRLDMFAKMESGNHVECPHCSGYGSSFKESADRCTKCGGEGLVTRQEAQRIVDQAKARGSKAMKARSLSQIGWEICRIWKKPYFGAVPYIAALKQLHNVHDDYGDEKGSSIVNYFLANAGSWKGEDAKRIKAELKAALKAPRVPKSVDSRSLAARIRGEDE